MKLAIISDIHGNLTALDAVLTELAEQKIDDILCLGDVAASGPQPREVIDRLKQRAIPVVVGNTDDWLLFPKLKEQTTLFGKNCQDIDLWVSQQLRLEDRAYLRSFQPTIAREVGGKLLLVYHGSPRSYNERIMATTSEEALAEALGTNQADIFIGGHTHIQLYRRHKAALVLNPGSVGLAMDRIWPIDEIRNPPWGEYAVLNVFDGHLNVDLRRIPFDNQTFVQACRESGMPHAA